MGKSEGSAVGSREGVELGSEVGSDVGMEVGIADGGLVYATVIVDVVTVAAVVAFAPAVMLTVVRLPLSASMARVRFPLATAVEISELKDFVALVALPVYRSESRRLSWVRGTTPSRATSSVKYTSTATVSQYYL